MFCRKCGASQPDDFLFCDKCGAGLTVETQRLQQQNAQQILPQMQQPAQTAPQMQPQYGQVQNQQQYQQPQNQPQQYQYQQPQMQQNVPQQKRSKAPLILGIVFGSLGLLAVIIVAVFLIFRSQTGSAGRAQDKTEVAEERKSRTDRKKKEEKKEPEEADSEDEDEDDGTESDPFYEEMDDVNQLTGDAAAQYAAVNSTTDRPTESDFAWLDRAYHAGEDLESYMAGLGATKVTNPAILNGDWKACFRTKNPMDNMEKETYRFFNVNLQTSGTDVELVLDWWYYSFGNGETGYEDDFDGRCSGKWNDDLSGFVCNDSERLEMKAFYDHNGRQFAYGEYLYPSGEQEYLILERPCGPSIPESAEVSQQNTTEQLTNEQIAELCAKHCGAQYARIDSVQSDGTLIVQVYDEVDGHTTTYDWYTVNPVTLDATTEFGFNFNLKDDM